MIIIIYSFIICVIWFDYLKIYQQFSELEAKVVEKDLLMMAKALNIKHVLVKRYLMMIMFAAFTYIISNNLLLAFIVMLMTYFLYYLFIKSRYHKLLKVTNSKFPYYLNNLAILIQQNPIVNALYKSIEYAPNIFKDDLYQLVVDIHNNAESIEPYLVFANKYKSIDDIQRIMRSLYNLSRSVENKQDMIVSLSKLCNEKLAFQFKEDLNNKLDRQMILPYILFVWLGIIMVQMIATIQLF